jgi:hypothetical protein
MTTAPLHLMLVAALAASVLAACGTCGDERITDATSPDGRFLARSFVRNCGATTSCAAHVEIREKSAWFQSAHTVFVAEGVMDPSVSWVGPRQIAITCNGCPSLRSSVSEWDGIQVALVHAPLSRPDEGKQ